MKNSKREYIILAVVIVVSVILLLLHRSEKVHYRLPDLERIQAENIETIEIKTPERELTITRSDGQWMLGEKRFPADASKIEELEKVIGQLQVTELISRAEDYHRYGLGEENVIEVKAFDSDGELLREFAVGEASATNQHTYVRFPEDQNVYHARDSFRYRLDRSMDDLRDKKALSFNRDEITAITAEYDSTTMVVKKSLSKPDPQPESEGEAEPAAASPAVAWVDDRGENLDAEAVDSLLTSASDLSCSKYLDPEEAKEWIDDSRLVYWIRFNGDQDYELKIYQKKGEDEQQYPALSSQNEYPFYLSSYTAEEIMKKRADLQKKEPDSGNSPPSD